MKLQLRHGFYGLAVLGIVGYGIASQDVSTTIQGLAIELTGVAIWEVRHSARERRRALLPAMSPLADEPPDPIVSLTAGDTFTGQGADADGRLWDEAATVTEVADNMVAWSLRYCRRDRGVELEVRQFQVVTWTKGKSLVGHYVEQGGLAQRGAVHWIALDANTFTSHCTFEEPVAGAGWRIGTHAYRMHRVQVVDRRRGQRVIEAASPTRRLRFADGTDATRGEIPPARDPEATGIHLPAGLGDTSLEDEREDDL